jgi:predicted glutamine amidotransferase
MCRMFGLLAMAPVRVSQLLRDAPRSLWTLAAEHRDGWGVALRESNRWQVHRDTACAQTSAPFAAIADTASAQILIAHVRQKTVGATALANTHPFQRGSLVFAHNGTVAPIAALADATSPTRAAEVCGDTDSERLFAYVATAIDRAGDVEAGIARALTGLYAAGDLGSSSFLLSCGQRIYAHRLGRALYALVRHGVAESRRTPTVVVASEPLTDEDWRELPDRSLHVLEPTAAEPQLRRCR